MTTETHGAQTDPVVNKFKAQSETCNKTHLHANLLLRSVYKFCHLTTKQR